MMPKGKKMGPRNQRSIYRSKILGDGWGVGRGNYIGCKDKESHGFRFLRTGRVWWEQEINLLDKKYRFKIPSNFWHRFECWGCRPSLAGSVPTGPGGADPLLAVAASALEQPRQL